MFLYTSVIVRLYNVRVPCDCLVCLFGANVRIVCVYVRTCIWYICSRCMRCVPECMVCMCMGVYS